ncbi:MAG: hypothetical protein AABZ30_02975 [Myxococcota bacterium]
MGIAALASSACVIDFAKSLHQYSMLDVEDTSPGTARPIGAETSDKVILGFAFETDYVDEAYRQLLAACPRGAIANVRARHSTDLGILAFRRKMKLDAVCVE